MANTHDLKSITQKIKTLRQIAEELKGISGDIPAMDCNVARLLAIVRLLELDFTDVSEL